MKDKWLTLLLSFNGGFVDTAGFLTLQGLFTAHVTGNFVTLAAAFVDGSAGTTAKLLALPVFCVVVLVTRLAGLVLERWNRPAPAILLTVKFVLLSSAAAYAVGHGHFDGGDNLPNVVLGMILVAAMAIQNAVHRLHFSKAPPSTLMTGTTTQVMIDLADLLAGRAGDDVAAVRSRLGQMVSHVLAFALGCGTAAAAIVSAGVWCFAIPPVIAALTAMRARVAHEAEAG
ncbi:YoaK family protein [Rhizobium puerariae]|uniref:YoaK family protein n=1 Tax=Rhizobium puerariae TaxID=1585791 RepID=A0ABV6AHF7_9HYPH